MDKDRIVARLQWTEQHSQDDRDLLHEALLDAGISSQYVGDDSESEELLILQ